LETKQTDSESLNLLIPGIHDDASRQRWC